MKKSFPATNVAAILALTLATSVVFLASAQSAETSPPVAWVATWQASPQPVWGADFLFPNHVPSELRDQTVRQIARVSVGGPRLRIVLSNIYGKQPMTVEKATVAQPLKNRSDGAIADGTLRTVTYGGQRTATILPGASVVSDPVALPISALEQVAVSVYVAGVTPVQTFHWDGRQTGWIVQGDQTQAPALHITDLTTQSTTARPLLTGIQVETAEAARAVVVIGDSITDGAAATLNCNSRWPDFLAARLAPQGIAVVNAGISGARLLSDGMGVNALARLERDVLAQPGVRTAIVMLGINDISWPGTVFAKEAANPTLESLTAGYRQLIAQAHSRGIRVIGATLTPFENALPSIPKNNYYRPEKDALRQQVNDWIRRSGAFDAVVDFDATLRDPDHPSRIAARYDSGDHLHPDDDGNRAMADAVDLDALFSSRSTATSIISCPTR